jgi:hypothetical protein
MFYFYFLKFMLYLNFICMHFYIYVLFLFFKIHVIFCIFWIHFINCILFFFYFYVFLFLFYFYVFLFFIFQFLSVHVLRFILTSVHYTFCSHQYTLIPLQQHTECSYLLNTIFCISFVNVIIRNKWRIKNCK